MQGQPRVTRKLIRARRVLGRQALSLYGLRPEAARLRLVDHLSSTLFRIDGLDGPKLLMRIIRSTTGSSPDFELPSYGCMR